jgi:hypothetical protein
MACLCRHMWFMHIGATLHDANIMLDFLDIVFGPRVMSNRYPDRHNCSNFWPPLSPALNPGHFNLWYSLREKLFPWKPSNKFEIREMLVQSCTEIEEDIVLPCYNGQVSSTSSNSKKLWPHWARTHTHAHTHTQIYTDVCTKWVQDVADKQHIYIFYNKFPYVNSLCASP